MNTDHAQVPAQEQEERHPLMERAELIVHLLKFSDRLFTIMSPVKGELAIFTNLLVKEGSPGLRFAVVTPDLALTAEDIAADLAQAWGVDVQFGESASQAIEQRLPALVQEPRRAVAMINDVERLPPSALNDLISFMLRMDSLTGGRVRLVLLGKPDLAQHLQGLKSLSEGSQIYALHLGSTAPASTHPASAGEDDGRAFVAENFSASAPQGHHHEDEKDHLPGRTLLIAGLGLSLVLAVAMALLLRPGEPEPVKESQISVPLESGTPVAVALPATKEPSTTTASTPTAAPSQTASSPTSIHPAPASEQAAPAAAATATPEPLAPASAPAAAADTPPPAAMPVEEAKPAPLAPATAPEHATPAGENVARNEPKPTSKPQRTTTPAATGKAWFTTQKATSYVLQVVSLKSARDVDQFVRRHGLKDCHSFTQEREGQTLHTLTCGLYSSREAALQAAAKLPEKARAGKPYPRRIDDIRKAMKP